MHVITYSDLWALLGKVGVPTVNLLEVCDDGLTHGKPFHTKDPMEQCPACGKTRKFARKFYWINPVVCFDLVVVEYILHLVRQLCSRFTIDQGKNGIVSKWFRSSSMCTELLFAFHHAFGNEFRSPAVLKDYCDGKRFMQFRRLFERVQVWALAFKTHYIICVILTLSVDVTYDCVQCGNGRMADWRNLVFALFLDDFVPGRNGYSSCAIVLTCLNLSATARSNVDNLLTIGFIPGLPRGVVGQQKTYSINVYLKPIVDIFENLARNGMKNCNIYPIRPPHIHLLFYFFQVF